MDEVWIAVFSLVTAKAWMLLGLWLRLRWRVRRERQRQQYLLQVVATVTAHGQVELNERDGDGHHLSVRAVRGAAVGEDREG
ncbi:hypothetical protein [Streptomyces sp. KL116D]|uniref:hypothetical protein n=1 Tax=Streptomyces sp. KL116D TaxID=3045152 RepID=UPI003557B053